MRYAPAAAALSLVLAITSSVAYGQQRTPNAQAATLIAEGRAALQQGQAGRATDAFEAALTVDPAYTPILIELAAAARREGLPGKAVGYYREALARDPRDFSAMAGEGAAFAEMGAVEKARATLTRLQSLCGAKCTQARELAAAINRAPVKPALAAETVVSKPAQN